MKILYTTHQFLPEYAAGTEILTYSTAREMKRRGHDVHVFTGYPLKGAPGKSNTFDRYECDGISVDRFFNDKSLAIRPRNPLEAEYNNLFVADYLRGRLREIKPDLVHFYHLQRLSASPIDVCREMGIPSLFTATDFWMVCPTNQLFLPDHSGCSGPDPGMVNCVRHLAAISQGEKVRFLLDRVPDRLMALCIQGIRSAPFRPEKGFLPLVSALAARPAFMAERLNRVDLVLTATRFMGETLSRHGLEKNRIRHLPFGIDTSPIAKVSEKGVEQDLRIGFIGTLYHHKGAHVLLEALRSLPADAPLKVRIYGHPGQFPAYTRMLHSLAGDDPRVAFCGTFPHPEIGAVLFDLDLLIIPSLWYENTPLILSFAQAARVPIVATDSEGMNEAISDNENGFLFPKGDAKGLAAILMRLCRDRSAVKRLSENARTPKPISAYGDELERIYDNVIHGRAAG